jgi:drug/metabolite transporter (DMT)-like permease
MVAGGDICTFCVIWIDTMDQINGIDLKQARLGYLYVSLAAILFAVSGTSAKYLFNASITATLEPISAGVIAAVFLGEMMGALQIVGGLIVIASILLLQFNSANH